MAVYVLKFHHLIGDINKPYATAGYYLGYSPDHLVLKRIEAHWYGKWREGWKRAPKLCRYAHATCNKFTVVCILWGGNRTHESLFKVNGNYHKRFNRIHWKTFRLDGKPAWMRSFKPDRREMIKCNQKDFVFKLPHKTRPEPIGKPSPIRYNPPAELLPF